MISRRRFVISAGGVAGAATIGGGAWAALVRDRVVDAASSEGSNPTTTSTTTPVSAAAAGGSDLVPVEDRVLVVLEMAGGNDGLNTLVPASALYRSARPTLAVAEQELVTLTGTDEFGLHPGLAPLVDLWEDGTMVAVEGVGMVDQSRSHFEAMDAWWSASPGAGSTTGWLGRWLDATLEGEPDPLRAIALGGGSRALVGRTSVATVVRDPAQFALRTTPGTDAEDLIAAFVATAEPRAGDPTLAAAQRAIPKTVEAIDILDEVTGGAGDGGSTPVRAEASTVSSLLQTAAGIVDLGIGTRVITVGMGGFDTHADQLDRHGDLLAELAAGVAGFFERLETDGHRDRVMLVTTSEFGRRVAENGSGGTDHGTAGVQFAFGPAVVGGRVVGELDLTALVAGDVPVTVDTRSLYSAALDWLGGPTDELLDGPHDRLGLLAP